MTFSRPLDVEAGSLAALDLSLDCCGVLLFSLREFSKPAELLEVARDSQVSLRGGVGRPLSRSFGVSLLALVFGAYVTRRTGTLVASL